MLKSDACVIFGATGDLALRMLFASLFYLESENRLEPGLRIIGVARQGLDRGQFVARVRKAVQERVETRCFDERTWARMAERLDYVCVDATRPEDMPALAALMTEVKAPLFYLATSPTLYGAICSQLAKARLVGKQARVVLEKPIGRDLDTSRAINDAVAKVFGEDRVFRIDHYLGKETVQNLLALRFANTVFEPLWNNLSIDHVQITVAETGGVGDRWSYYDDYGASRDMLQNHMLQLLALVAMEPPSDMNAAAIRNEKVKVLRSLRRITTEDVGASTLRGQYVAGVIDGEAVRGYPEERGQESSTETFLTLRADIDNWRWAGVPFYLRTGKRLPTRRTQIVVQFKPVPYSIFGQPSRIGLTPNRLVIDLQPQENIELLLMNKSPGMQSVAMDLQPLTLSLSLHNAFGAEGARRRIAYERLLLDAMDGVQTLFVGRDEIEEAWSWIDGIADAWAETDMSPLAYAAGAWGPTEARSFIEASGRRWND